jgi:hypothetical protein
MLPNYTGGHAAYQEFVVSQLRKYYPDPYSISRADWEIVERFWLLDLSAIFLYATLLSAVHTIQNLFFD